MTYDMYLFYNIFILTFLSVLQTKIIYFNSQSKYIESINALLQGKQLICTLRKI